MAVNGSCGVESGTVLMLPWFLAALRMPRR
jgi:hypothetical protein